MNPRFRSISTSTLRAMLLSLSKRPWCRILAKMRLAVLHEIIVRDSHVVADDLGAFPVAPVDGVQ